MVTYNNTGQNYFNSGQNYTNYGQNYTNYGQEALRAAGIGSPPGKSGPAAPPPGQSAQGRFGASYANSLANASAAYGNIISGYLGGANPSAQGGLDAYAQREQALNSQTDVLGQNQLAQANQYYNQQGQSAVQNSISRGLNNSTVANSLQQGVNAQRDYDVNQINNNTAQQKLSVSQAASADRLGYYERTNAQAQSQALQQQQLAQQASQFDRQLQLQRDSLLRTQVAVGGSPANRSGGGGGSGYRSPSQSMFGPPSNQYNYNQVPYSTLQMQSGLYNGTPPYQVGGEFGLPTGGYSQGQTDQNSGENNPFYGDNYFTGQNYGVYGD